MKNKQTTQEEVDSILEKEMINDMIEDIVGKPVNVDKKEKVPLPVHA